MNKYGKMRENFVLEPYTGKAFPVYKGEVYRIEQEYDGQCVDINAFNLHDYRDRMETSIMRRQGFHLQVGQFIITDSPRCRLLMQIIDKSPSCVVDVILHRCSEIFNYYTWGLENTANCQDMQAAAIGEYGLTADDVHAVLCPFTNTQWTSEGKIIFGSNKAVKKGDYIDFLALMDTLISTNICGSNDFTTLGNYFARSARLQIFEPSEYTNKMVEAVFEEYPALHLQKIPEKYDENYKIKRIPNYKPYFHHYPQKIQKIEVDLSEDEYKIVKKLIDKGICKDESEAMRTAFMEWYAQNRLVPSPIGVF